MRLYVLILVLFTPGLLRAQAPTTGIYDLKTPSYPYSISILSGEGDTVYRKAFDEYGHLVNLENDVRSFKVSYFDSVNKSMLLHSLKNKQDSMYRVFYENGRLKSHYYIKEGHEGYETYYSNGKPKSSFSDAFPYCIARNFNKQGRVIYINEQGRNGISTLTIHTDSGFVSNKWKISSDGDTLFYYKSVNGRTIEGFDTRLKKRIWSINDTTYIVTANDSSILRGRFQQDRYEYDGTHHQSIDIWGKDSKTSINYKEHPDSGIYYYHFQYRNFISNTKALRYEWKKDLSQKEAYIEKRYHDFPKSTSPLQYEVRMDRDSNLLYTYNSSYYDMYNLKKELIWSFNSGHHRIKYKRPRSFWFRKKHKLIREPYMPHHSTIYELPVRELPRPRKSGLGSDTAEYHLHAVSLNTGVRKYSQDDFIKSLFKAELNGLQMNFDEFIELVTSMLESYQLEHKIPFPYTIEFYIDDKFENKGRIRLTGDGESSARPFANELQVRFRNLMWTYGKDAKITYQVDGSVKVKDLKNEKPEVFMLFHHIVGVHQKSIEKTRLKQSVPNH